MKYLLMALSAYSVGTGFWFMNADQSLTPFFIGSGLGLILLVGALALAIGDLFGGKK